MLDITYDRTQRQYEWTNPDSGETLTAPCGAANKADLFKQAVALLDPDLYQAAVHWLEDEPSLERILWRGVELVTKSAVETLLDAGLTVAKVASSDQYGRYSITIEDGYLACECPHWRDMNAPYASNGQRVCKHLAAFTLHQRTRETRF
jgi:hypothetical protein